MEDIAFHVCAVPFVSTAVNVYRQFPLAKTQRKSQVVGYRPVDAQGL